MMRSGISGSIRPEGPFHPSIRHVISGDGMSKRRMKPVRSSLVSHREMPAEDLQQNPNERIRTP